MDPDLIFGPNGKQKNTLGQPYWNKAKMYISNPPGPIYFSEADVIGLSS